MLRILPLIAILLLPACRTTEELSSQSSMQLCIDLLSKPKFNVNREKRIKILSERGENCSAYAAAANAQIKADRDFWDSLSIRRTRSAASSSNNGRLDELERKQKEDKFWRDYNCPNAAWRKGYC